MATNEKTGMSIEQALGLVVCVFVAAIATLWFIPAGPDFHLGRFLSWIVVIPGGAIVAALFVAMVTNEELWAIVAFLVWFVGSFWYALS